MLSAGLAHHLGEVVVQVSLDPLGLARLLVVDLADQLRLGRATGGPHFHDGLCLKPHRGFGEDRVIDTAGAGPGSGAVLDLQPEEVEPFDVLRLPVGA
jgi:hypothetical protein